MNKYLLRFTRFSLLCLLLCSKIALANTVNVFFAGGQSNAKQAWADSIAHTLSTSGVYSDVLVVNTIHSGNWLYQWYTDTPGSNYFEDFYNSNNTGTLESALSEIEQAGNSYVFSGLFWFQGEGDTASGRSIEQYESRFNGMLGQLYSDINNGAIGSIDYTLAVIDANPLFDIPAGREREQIEALRDVQINMADDSEYGSYVDSRGYERSDEFHLTRSALESLGAEMANTFITTHALNPVPLSPALLFFGTGLIGLFSYAKPKLRSHALISNITFS